MEFSTKCGLNGCKKRTHVAGLMMSIRLELISDIEIVLYVGFVLVSLGFDTLLQLFCISFISKNEVKLSYGHK